MWPPTPRWRSPLRSQAYILGRPWGENVMFCSVPFYSLPCFRRCWSTSLLLFCILAHLEITIESRLWNSVIVKECVVCESKLAPVAESVDSMHGCYQLILWGFQGQDWSILAGKFVRVRVLGRKCCFRAANQAVPHRIDHIWSIWIHFFLTVILI